MPHVTDLDLSAKNISNLSSADAIAGFLTNLGYPTGHRKELTASSLGLTGDSAQAVQQVELMAADEDGFFRVVFAKVRSITAMVRNGLARRVGQTGSDHLILLASNFDMLEFVLLDKRTRQQKGRGHESGSCMLKLFVVERATSLAVWKQFLKNPVDIG